MLKEFSGKFGKIDWNYRDFEKNYQKFKTFIEKLHATPEPKEQKEKKLKIPPLNTDSIDYTDILNETPEKPQYDREFKIEKDTPVTIEEALRRYQNLLAKGYIKDPRTLSLPYVVEKSENGWPLSKTEQDLLQEWKKPSSWKKLNVAKSTLFLQAIGLITDYKTDFPKLASTGFYYIDEHYMGAYNIRNDEDRTQFIKDLRAEADSPDFVSVTHLYPLDSDRSRKRCGLQEVASKGLEKGVETDEIQKAENEIERNFYGDRGEKDGK